MIVIFVVFDMCVDKWMKEIFIIFMYYDWVGDVVSVCLYVYGILLFGFEEKFNVVNYFNDLK